MNENETPKDEGTIRIPEVHSGAGTSRGGHIGSNTPAAIQLAEAAMRNREPILDPSRELTYEPGAPERDQGTPEMSAHETSSISPESPSWLTSESTPLLRYAAFAGAALAGIYFGKKLIDRFRDRPIMEQVEGVAIYDVETEVVPMQDVKNAA